MILSFLSGNDLLCLEMTVKTYLKQVTRGQGLIV